VKAALAWIAAAAGCVLAGAALIAVTWHLSFWHGLYCSVGTAATVGCDTAPRGAAGQAVAVGVMLTAIPCLASAFSHIHLHRHRKMRERDKQGGTGSEAK
jgi:hypothetical protein